MLVFFMNLIIRLSDLPHRVHRLGARMDSPSTGREEQNCKTNSSKMIGFSDFRMELSRVPEKRRGVAVVSGDAGSAACLAELSDTGVIVVNIAQAGLPSGYKGIGETAPVAL